MIYPQDKPPLAELAHHGVKGQRWGFRKEEDLHPREAAKQNDVQKESFARRHRKALIVAGILAAYGTYKVVDSGQANQLVLKGKEFVTHQQFDWATKKSLTRKMPADQIMNTVVRDINPGYGGLGTKMNCRRCTFAYEMRRRGLDVRATKSIRATGQTAMGVGDATTPNLNKGTSIPSVVFNLAKEGKEGPTRQALTRGMGETVSGMEAPHALTRARLLYEHLGKQPEGARGELSVGWSMGGYHSMAWEIINGKPVVFDCQSGRYYPDHDKFVSVAEGVKKASTIRLDNSSLNGPFLKRWVANAS